jgi:hypothetical protein
LNYKEYSFRSDDPYKHQRNYGMDPPKPTEG